MDIQTNQIENVIQRNERIKQFNQNPQASPLESEDQGKWELDTSPWLNRVYHELLGETLIGGEWLPDPHKKKFMNELGANKFVTDISSRVSIHMQFSDLDTIEIIEIASRAAEIFGDNIEDHWQEWEIEPTFSNFESIAQKMYDILLITLKIAKEGGMKLHREKKSGYQVQPSPESGVI